MPNTCNDISSQQLGAIMKGASADAINTNLPHINRAMCSYGITSPLQQAHFLAQVGHESTSLKRTTENMNYSADRLKKVFPKYFTPDVNIQDYAGKPEKIGNRVYADRMGNGNETSGDGFKFRGRGLTQLTGKNNYQKFSKAVGVDLVKNPDKVATDPWLRAQAAGWHWQSNGLNKFADTDDVKGMSRKLNGGTNGLEDRKAYLNRAKGALGVKK